MFYCLRRDLILARKQSQRKVKMLNQYYANIPTAKLP